jgi:hypothetical protein
MIFFDVDGGWTWSDMTHRKRMQHESIAKTDAAAIFLNMHGSAKSQSFWIEAATPFFCRRHDDGEEEKRLLYSRRPNDRPVVDIGSTKQQ